MIIVCDESNGDLAKRISLKTEIPYVTLKLETFPSGEYKIENFIRYKKTFLLFPKVDNVNSAIFRFFIMAAACSGCKAQALIPFLPYSRQNRSNGACFFLNMVKAAGISKITTLDLHSAIRCDGLAINNILPDKIFSQFFQNKNDLILVAPDLGAINRTRSFAEKLNTDFVVFDKAKNILYDNKKVFGKSCLIVDDIIDSGKTINKTADILKINNAKEIMVCASHGILSQKQISDDIKKIFISESFDIKLDDNRITIVPIHEILSVHIC